MPFISNYTACKTQVNHIQKNMHEFHFSPLSFSGPSKNANFIAKAKPKKARAHIHLVQISNKNSNPPKIKQQLQVLSELKYFQWSCNTDSIKYLILYNVLRTSQLKLDSNLLIKGCSNKSVKFTFSDSKTINTVNCN